MKKEEMQFSIKTIEDGLVAVIRHLCECTPKNEKEAMVLLGSLISEVATIGKELELEE